VDHFVDVPQVLDNGGADRFEARNSQGLTLGQVFDLMRNFGYYSGLGWSFGWVGSAGRILFEQRSPSMYAVIKTGGKQYRVAPGEKIKIEQIPADVGAQIVLDQVLMVSDGDAVKLGNPLVSGAKVSATVIAHGRGTKVKIFKMRRRKHYQKTQGHRQNYTEIRVDAIA
jgi:large subunit ribosomal protein L21